MTWFNEIDPIACAVLRRCYDGVVCERSIKDVRPGDLDDHHSRRHWFAGAGLWEVACRLAGWPAERELWTASCPCQGESVAGKRLGALDPRDLWPDFFAIVRTQRPACVVGEQVDAAVGTHWLDRAAADMENAGYAFRAVDIPACAVDAPHRRNRIYWVAMEQSDRSGLNGRAWRTQEGRWNLRECELLPATGGSVGHDDPERQVQPQGRVETFGGRRGDADARGAVADAEERQRWVREPETDDGPTLPFGRHDISWRSDRGISAVEHVKGERWGEGRPEYELRGGRNAAAITDGARAMANAPASGGWRRGLCGPQESQSATGEWSSNQSSGPHDRSPVADAYGGGRDGRPQDAQRSAERRDATERTLDNMDDASGAGQQGLANAEWIEGGSTGRAGAQRADRRNSRSYWDDAEWLRCADGKARRAKPGIRLLVDGLAGRTDLWRLAGNSIVPQLAAEVLMALMDVT